MFRECGPQNLLLRSLLALSGLGWTGTGLAPDSLLFSLLYIFISRSRAADRAEHPQLFTSR